MSRSILLIMERVAIWLGRSPMMALAIARLALTLVTIGDMGVIAYNNPDLASAISTGQWILFLWNMCCLGALAMPPRLEIQLRPMILVIDGLFYLTLVALLRPLSLPAIACLSILSWAIYERLGRNVTTMFCMGMVLTFLLRGHYEPWAEIFALQHAWERSDITTVFIAGLGGICIFGGRVRRTQLASWCEQLQAAGGNLNDLPIGFLLQEVARIFSARKAAIIWEDLERGMTFALLLEEGETKALPLDPGQCRALISSGLYDTPLLFSHASDRILLRNALGILRFQEAASLVGMIGDLLRIQAGNSFPIGAGAIRGRVFVASPHGWSSAILNQVDRVQDGVEGFFERHFFLAAWRDRAFVEARHSLSCDLHDSVLQTLAALRMRFATLSRTLADQVRPEDLEELNALQSLIIAEQAHLRNLLNETARHAHASEALSNNLARCADLVSRQWNVRCEISMNMADIAISRATAIEIEFLIREVVANAVQHAGARHVIISAAISGNELILLFRDDSVVQKKIVDKDPIPGMMVQSRSLARRLTSLGGSAYFDDLHKTSLLSIRIPVNRKIAG